VTFPAAGTFSLTVYNSAGEEVNPLVPPQDVAAPFDQWFQWNGKNKFGDKVASGVYLIEVTEPYATRVARVILIK
jgi:hypothetical protein